MGRWYQGDIEGKFWFAVQGSDVAERFGCTPLEQPSIDYYISSDDIELITNELKAIEDKLGDELKKFNDFFNKNNGYNDQKLIDAGLDPTLLEDYADYGFGQKLLKCVQENGECNFTAEL